MKESYFFLSIVGWAVATVAVLIGGSVVYAAPLNFSTAENISLTSPATTLTIATGSVADALKVTTSSVVVTLSSSTGGIFTLLSSSYDLTVATSSSGGTPSISCSAGVDNIAISQVTGSTIYTITTAGTNCATPVISSGGGGGVVVNVGGNGAGYVLPATTTTASSAGGSSTTSNSSLLAEIAGLQAELQTLLKEAGGSSTPTTGPSFVFTRDLTIGSTGNDVKALQHYLNTNGFSLRASGSGSLGEETTYFGSATQNALARYQKKFGITPSIGYFGPKTRAYVNAHE